MKIHLWFVILERKSEGQNLVGLLWFVGRVGYLKQTYYLCGLTYNQNVNVLCNEQEWGYMKTNQIFCKKSDIVWNSFTFLNSLGIQYNLNIYIYMYLEGT